MKMMLSEIAQTVEGQFNNPDMAVASVSVDTRALQLGPLYVGIKARHFDSRDFVGKVGQAERVQCSCMKTQSQNAVEVCGEGVAFFVTEEALNDTLNQELTGNETILIKGSRNPHMENVAAALVNNFRN